MFKSSDVAYLKPYYFNNISLILGIGYCLHFNCLFRFINSLRKCTQFDLVLGFAKNGDPHSESFALPNTPSRTKLSASFLTFIHVTLVNLYDIEHIRFTSYFHFNSTGSVFQVPSVPSYNSLNFCNHFSNSLRCVSVIFWHWVFITLFKSVFSHLGSKITRHCLV